MASALPTRQIVVDVLTPSYRIVGKIQVSHTGDDWDIERSSDFVMEVREASMARLDQPTKLVDRFRVVRIMKERAFAVCLGRRDDVGSVAWARGGYGYQYDYPVKIVSPVYELEGIFEWSERFDLHAIMVEGTRDFLPLFDVDLRAVLLPNMRMETPAVLFNRKHVDVMALQPGTTGELQGGATGDLKGE